MAKLILPDYHVSDSVSQALASATAFGESTVESQHVRAVAILTARTSNDAVETAAIAAAITQLNNALLKIRK